MIVGFDGTDDGKAAVAKGKLAATVANSLPSSAPSAWKPPTRCSRGQPVEKSIPVPLQIVNK